MAVIEPRNNFGSFVPTTNVWDVAQLYEIDVTSPAFKELLVRLYQNVNTIALTLNTKDSGIYDVNQFVNGQIFFPNPATSAATQATPEFRQVYRLVVNFGALPNAGTKSVAHGIVVNTATTFTRIYGAASDTTALSYIPVPYAATTAVGDNISLTVDATNVTINTGTNNRSNYNICYVILEYMFF
jgi:hypothetical protein